MTKFAGVSTKFKVTYILAGFCTLVTFALSVTVLTGCTNTGAGKGLYLFKYRTKNLSIHPETTTTTTGTSTDKIGDPNQAGLWDEYRAGVVGMCFLNTDGLDNVEDGHCGRTVKPLTLTLTDIADAASSDYYVPVSEHYRGYENTLRNCQKAVYVISFIAVPFAGLTAVELLLLFLSPAKLGVGAVISSAITALLLILADSMAAGIYFTYQHMFNEGKGTDYESPVAVGPVAFALMLVSCLTAMGSSVAWLGHWRMSRRIYRPPPYYT